MHSRYTHTHTHTQRERQKQCTARVFLAVFHPCLCPLKAPGCTLGRVDNQLFSLLTPVFLVQISDYSNKRYTPSLSSVLSYRSENFLCSSRLICTYTKGTWCIHSEFVLRSGYSVAFHSLDGDVTVSFAQLFPLKLYNKAESSVYKTFTLTDRIRLHVNYINCSFLNLRRLVGSSFKLLFGLVLVM